jgi:toxin ParE1/3/4
MTCGFEKEALEEYRETAAWYESQRPGLGAVFVDAVELSVKEILRDPERFQKVDTGLRVYRMKRFPYRLIFRWLEERQHVTIFVVMHIRRKPGYWTARLQDNE